MPNFYTDNEDLRYYIERGVDWEPLVRLTEGDFKDPEGPENVDEAVSGTVTTRTGLSRSTTSWANMPGRRPSLSSSDARSIGTERLGSLQRFLDAPPEGSGELATIEITLPERPAQPGDIPD